MINRLSNPINRNRSAAKILKVMSSSGYTPDLDCYDYQSTCGANNMLANPIVTFDNWYPTGMGAGEPLFLGDRWPSNIVFFWLFIPNFLGAVFFIVGRFGSFFSQLVFLAWTKTLHSQLWERPQKITPHTTMHCVPSACGFMENHCQDCCYLGYANIFGICILYDICYTIALKCVRAT